MHQVRLEQLFYKNDSPKFNGKVLCEHENQKLKIIIASYLFSNKTIFN